jgi:uncharacterized surface protein with fasciclin (FAS1) repeats
MMSKHTVKLLILSMASLILVACNSSSSNNTIVDRVIVDPELTTLATAVVAAGLVETLDSEGPFTLFAPIDNAFAQLPAGTVEYLLENPEALANILTFHVVQGRFLAEDVVATPQFTTVQGGRLVVRVTEGGVRVNNANVILTDIEVDNGVIHLIDTVLLP